MLWCAAVVFGLSALLAGAPWLYAGIKPAGGLYLLYLGATLWSRPNELPSSTSIRCLAPGTPLGRVFGLLTVAHIWRIMVEPHFATDPWHVLITVVGAALCLWACRLLWLAHRS